MSTSVNVQEGVKEILRRVQESYAKAQAFNPNRKAPILVAVSKTKPVDMILDAYSVGQRHFGENYVQELVEKANDPKILENCKEIKWHYIGHLQRNKINKMINLPNLFMIQTVDSQKLADGLNNALAKISSDKKLEVLIQINTSSEDEKNGVEPENAGEIYRYVKENCKHLDVKGVMTIGRFGHDYSTGKNPDFGTLVECHQDICTTFELNPDEIGISMGMSDDFDHAIEAGSTIVRVGSSIFGYRAKKN